MAKEYVFEGDRIKLNQRDYDKFSRIYSSLDLDAELEQLDLELREESNKSWFMTLNAKLNYRNKKAKDYGPHRQNRRETPAESAISQAQKAHAIAERAANQASVCPLGENGPVVPIKMEVARG